MYLVKSCLGNKSWSGWFWLVLAVIVMTKVAVVATYGPLKLGDQTFAAAADFMLLGSGWLHDLDLSSSHYPPTLYRTLGMSFVIAGAKFLSADHWPVLVSMFHATLSLICGLLLYRLARVGGLSVLIASVVMVLYQWSVPLSTDALIMEDGIMGAVLTIAILLILTEIAKGHTPSIKLFFLLGLATAIGHLFRDVLHFILPFLSVAAVFLLWRAGEMRKVIPALLVIILPTVAVTGALKSWNTYRIGHPVVTTGGQSGYLYAVLRAARHDPSVLDGDSDFLKLTRRLNQHFDFQDTVLINIAMFEELNMNAVEQLRVTGNLYWSTMASHPVAYSKAAIERLRPIQQATLFAGPITRIDDLDWWRSGAVEEGFRVGWRAEAQKFRQSLDPKDLTPEVAWHLGIRALSRAVGLVFLAIFIFGAPVYWLLNRRPRPDLTTVVGLSWLVYLLWVSLYIPANFEIRYLSPVIAPALFSMVVITCTFISWCYNRWRGGL